jgi:hypothetical protein
MGIRIDAVIHRPLITTRHGLSSQERVGSRMNSKTMKLVQMNLALAR